MIAFDFDVTAGLGAPTHFDLAGFVAIKWEIGPGFALSLDLIFGNGPFGLHLTNGRTLPFNGCLSNPLAPYAAICDLDQSQQAFGTLTMTYRPTTEVPVPASMLLLATAAAALVAMRRGRARG